MCDHSGKKSAPRIAALTSLDEPCPAFRSRRHLPPSADGARYQMPDLTFPEPRTRGEATPENCHNYPGGIN